MPRRRERTSKSPWRDLWRPLAVILVCLGLGLGIVGYHRLVHAIALDNNVTITPVLLALSWLLPMNVLLLVFNLVPAFPLDGGRIARSIVWRVTGNKAHGTRIAAKLGQGFAVVLAGVGLWLILAYTSFSGLWLLALAYLLGPGRPGRDHPIGVHRTDRGGARVRHHGRPGRGDPGADTGGPGPGRVLFALPAQSGCRWSTRRGASGHRPPRSGPRPPSTPARDGSRSEPCSSPRTTSWRVDAERPISELLGSESLPALGALIAVDADGVLRGVVTTDQVRRALQSAFRLAWPT